MPGFSGYRKLDKKNITVQLMFWSVTLVMLITRYLSFYTFKGSDDLHYAFLSSSVLNGSYDIFFANDIYAARALVILYQSAWFKLFGINDFSMCMPSLSLLIILAYFVCFRSGLQKNWYTVVLAAALVYFNPVTVLSTSGNLPDVYIALIVALVFFLIKKNTDCYLKNQHLLSGIYTGLLLLAGLFVKESIVLVYAATAVLLFYYRDKISFFYVTALATTVFIGGVGYLCFYYLNTGDVFYHFVQIRNSAFFNPCRYDCLPKIYLFKRLTITIPYNVMLTGAYPLLVLTPVLFVHKHRRDFDARFWKITLASLLILALYFPFSVFPYVPLCHDMRQFFFLFPPAVIIYLSALREFMLTEKHLKAMNIGGAAVFTLTTFICLYHAPYNKWGIFCNVLLALVFIFTVFVNKKAQRFLLYLAVPCILWLSTAYTVIKKPHNGYSELKTLQNKLKQDTSFITNTSYFLNNDTKTHVAFINRFDTAKHYIVLDTVQNGFKPFMGYQLKNAVTRPPGFKQGWLIVSDHYVENLGNSKIAAIDHLLAEIHCGYRVNKTSAYYLTSAETMKKIMDIINIKTPGRGCN